MGRLIDADDFINYMLESEKSASENEKYDNGDNIDREMYYSTASLIDVMKYNAPTVDAVQVVRCKGCANRGTLKCTMRNYDLDDQTGRVLSINDWTKDDGFCSSGERKEDNDGQ